MSDNGDKFLCGDFPGRETDSTPVRG